MPVFYAENVVENGVQRMSETAPADLFSAVGWNVGNLAANNSAMLAPGTERPRTDTAAPNGFNTTVKPGTLDPVARAFRSATPLNGTFDAGNWTLTAAMHTTSTGTQQGRLRFRLWRGPNADGSGATMIDTADRETPIITGFSALSTVYSQSVTFNPGALALSNEYLFITTAWLITTAGGNTARTVRFAFGATRTAVSTPNFVSAAVSVDRAGGGLAIASAGGGTLVSQRVSVAKDGGPFVTALAGAVKSTIWSGSGGGFTVLRAGGSAQAISIERVSISKTGGGRAVRGMI